jgi:hypothetical protein
MITQTLYVVHLDKPGEQPQLACVLDELPDPDDRTIMAWTDRDRAERFAKKRFVDTRADWTIEVRPVEPDEWPAFARGMYLHGLRYLMIDPRKGGMKTRLDSLYDPAAPPVLTTNQETIP